MPIQGLKCRGIKFSRLELSGLELSELGLEFSEIEFNIEHARIPRNQLQRHRVQQTWPQRNRVQKTRLQPPKLIKTTSSGIQVQCSGSQKLGLRTLQDAKRRPVGSGGARKSAKWVQEAVCTIATDVSLTPPRTADRTGCRFYRQGRGPARERS